jgi:uncharacterized protein (TIGR02118 family)
VTRILVLARERLDAVARELAGTDGVREVSVYGASGAAHGLPGAATFEALVDVVVESVRDLQIPAGAFAYRVDERKLKAYSRTWPDGVATPGVVLVAPVFRAPALSRDAFDTHWRDRHGPLALEHHAGMWDYRQARVVEVLVAGAPPFDGIARLGFPSLGAYEAGLFPSRASRRAIGEDTARFVDVGRLSGALLHETILKSA